MKIPIAIGVHLNFDELVEQYKETGSYAITKNMGKYGDGIFAARNMTAGELFLPFCGHYSISESTKHEDHPLDVIDPSRKEGNSCVSCSVEDVKSNSSEFYCSSDGKDLSSAHAAKYLPEKPLYRGGARKNLSLGMATFKHVGNRYNYYYLTNYTPVLEGDLLGWDYGLDYWLAMKKNYVEWNEKGSQVLGKSDPKVVRDERDSSTDPEVKRLLKQKGFCGDSERNRVQQEGCAALAPNLVSDKEGVPSSSAPQLEQSLVSFCP